MTEETTQHAVVEWWMKQAGYVSPAEHHVLGVLAMSAFYTSDNREGEPPGRVMYGRSSIQSIRAATGLSESTVKRALRSLQEATYILTTERRASGARQRGPQSIHVFWNEGADDLREQIRKGLKEVPAVFLAKHKKYDREAVQDNVVDLPLSVVVNHNGGSQ